MERKKHIILLSLNAFAFVGTIAWAIAEPSYEPFIGIFLAGSTLLGLFFTGKEPSKIHVIGRTTDQGKTVEISHENSQDSDPAEPIGGQKVKVFPDSTVFFYDRFCSAFPGVRGIKWFEKPDEAIQRLSRLLEYRLTLINEKGNSWYNPICGGVMEICI